MRNTMTAALMVATVLGIFASSTSASAAPCRFSMKDKAWEHCTPALGKPDVEPEKYMHIKAPQKGAEPAEGCELIKSGKGVDRWSCPAGTADRLREAMSK